MVSKQLQNSCRAVAKEKQSSAYRDVVEPLRLLSGLEYPYASGECAGCRRSSYGRKVMEFRARGHGRRGVANRGGNVELPEEIRRL